MNIFNSLMIWNNALILPTVATSSSALSVSVLCSFWILSALSVDHVEFRVTHTRVLMKPPCVPSALQTFVRSFYFKKRNKFSKSFKDNMGNYIFILRRINLSHQCVTTLLQNYESVCELMPVFYFNFNVRHVLYS